MRLAFGALLVALLVPVGSSAGVSSNDLSPGLSYSALVSSASGAKTETLDFSITGVFSWDGGVAAMLKYQLSLPAGLTWAGGAPGPASGCTRTTDTAVCTKSIVPTPGTNLAAAFGPLLVVAEHPGAYRVTALILDTGGTDANSSNDTTSLDVVVGGPPGKARVTPRSPKAGSTVVVSSGVFLQSIERTYPAIPNSVVCVAKIGGLTVKPRPSRSSGRAACTIKTLASAKGKVVSGTIRIAAGELKLVKQFSAKLR